MFTGNLEPIKRNRAYSLRASRLQGPYILLFLNRDRPGKAVLQLGPFDRLVLTELYTWYRMRLEACAVYDSMSCSCQTTGLVYYLS